jgi:hypothetical protein
LVPPVPLESRLPVFGPSWASIPAPRKPAAIDENKHVSMELRGTGPSLRKEQEFVTLLPRLPGHPEKTGFIRCGNVFQRIDR